MIWPLCQHDLQTHSAWLARDVTSGCPLDALCVLRPTDKARLCCATQHDLAEVVQELCPLSQRHLQTQCLTSEQSSWTLDWAVSPPVAQLCDLGVPRLPVVSPAGIKGCQRWCVLCVFRAALTRAQVWLWLLLTPCLPPLRYHTCWNHISGELLMSQLQYPAQNGGYRSLRVRLEK